MCDLEARYERPKRTLDRFTELMLQDSVQVNIPAESGEMGILANHVPAIEQLKPGLVEIIEEAGASKQFFRTSNSCLSISPEYLSLEIGDEGPQNIRLTRHDRSFRRLRHRSARL
jgi:hypothetical protein